MFVVIYTPGPAWLPGKSAIEQPVFREHRRYMYQFFADKRVLMGGPFLDNQGGLGIIDVTTEAQAQEIVAHDPAVLANVFHPHVHAWGAYRLNTEGRYEAVS
ncbi:MAG: YciI family protein [Chloroflexota bacterium]|nr:YciI family protein [Chloroflexota bacterium]